jgi:hypothetical protein
LKAPYIDFIGYLLALFGEVCGKRRLCWLRHDPTTLNEESEHTYSPSHMTLHLIFRPVRLSNMEFYRMDAACT